MAQDTMQRFQSFDADPGWEGVANRATLSRTVVQDFGDSRTNHAGGETPGEIGGRISRSLTPATYAMAILTRTLEDRLTASGKFAVMQADKSSGALIGWFNSKTYIGAPPENFVGILIEGPSRVGHYSRPVYADTKGNVDASRQGPLIKPNSEKHTWTLEYDPNANSGRGRIRAALDDEGVALNIQHPRNASFDRFGLLSYQRGGHYVDIYFDDIAYTAAPENK